MLSRLTKLTAATGVAALLALWACVGDDPADVREGTSGGDAAVDGSTTSSSTSSSSSSTSSSSGGDGAIDGSPEKKEAGPPSCAAIPDNLLANYSFEDLLNGVPTNWSSDPPLLPKTNSAGLVADDCDRWAELTTVNMDSYLSQAVNLPAEAQAGAMFEIGFSARSLDGNTTPLYSELRIVGAGYTPKLTQSLDSTGEWTRFSAQLPLAENGTKIQLVIEGNTSSPRKIAIDRAFLRRLP